VEPLWASVRQVDPEAAGWEPAIFELDLAPRRGFREPQAGAAHINGELHYLWRAVDHEGEVLEVYVTKRRDRKAALRFLRRTMKRYGNPQVVVTDHLKSYKAAMKVIGNASRQETGRWLNNRAENSHLPFRRKERAMGKFRSFETLQKFASAHSSVHNHFSHERHLNRREAFKQNRSAALAEWRQLAA
tara:strand:+ start:14056 stop:14619 length:564 start_codon:yes stop_codon:yes gene_type:complete